MKKSLKSAMRLALRKAISTRNGGLSSFGKCVKRSANYIQFHIGQIEKAEGFSMPARRLAGGWNRNLEGKTVFDIGANHGQNIRYYLARGLSVVAVEANPHLCQAIRSEFSSQCNLGSVRVVNACITDRSATETRFYVHRTNDKLSSFIPPDQMSNFDSIVVPAVSIEQLIRMYGLPFFAKFDVEGLDASLLRQLFQAGFRPEYISAEAHKPDVLVEMIRAGYDAFKVVDGPNSNSPYYTIDDEDLTIRFDYHSAGPFGEDIPGEWFDSSGIIEELSVVGFGWKDLHAKWCK